MSKVSAGLFPSEASLLGLEMAMVCPGVVMLSFLCCVSFRLPLLIETSVILGYGPPW